MSNEIFEDLMETNSFRRNYNFNNFSNADAKRLWEYQQTKLDQKDAQISKLQAEYNIAQEVIKELKITIETM